ncbi:unnamed protein product [Caenorhabditis sp. 36 PRJEB53466]|nr:unnamed protein product [Caenorhabditis sp. 36 PRJEB53466]
MYRSIGRSVSSGDRALYNFEIDQFSSSQILPCLPSFIYDLDIFVFTLDVSAVVIVFLISLFTIISECAFFLMIVLLLSAEQVQSGSISSRAFHTQNLLFFKLILQVIIPLLTLIIPLVYAIYSVSSNTYNQALNNLLITISASTHGLVASTFMILAHPQFRSPLCFRKSLPSNRMVVLELSSRNRVASGVM